MLTRYFEYKFKTEDFWGCARILEPTLEAVNHGVFVDKLGILSMTELCLTWEGVEKTNHLGFNDILLLHPSRSKRVTRCGMKSYHFLFVQIHLSVRNRYGSRVKSRGCCWRPFLGFNECVTLFAVEVKDGLAFDDKQRAVLNAIGQGTELSHKLGRSHKSSTSTGSDFWVRLPSNL